MLKNFEELVTAAKIHPALRRMAIPCAADGAVIEAALRASRAGLAAPVFIGNEGAIRTLLREQGENPADFDIVRSVESECGALAAELVREGSAHILMKGLMETRDFLSPIVKKENGLRTGAIMSHAVFFQLPNYPKLLMTSDGGMVMYPTLEDKKHIIENATFALRSMGYVNPKHAVVCAIETVNPKMVETVDAAALAEMNANGEIRDCAVIGPISYDVAMSVPIAEHKGYACPYVGDFDCLIMPNMQAGNILGKCFTVTVGAPMAGVVLGAKAPVVMTSRGSSAQEKFYSIAMASLIASGCGR